jgi:hypothetical protein
MARGLDGDACSFEELRAQGGHACWRVEAKPEAVLAVRGQLPIADAGPFNPEPSPPFGRIDMPFQPASNRKKPHEAASSTRMA